MRLLCGWSRDHASDRISSTGSGLGRPPEVGREDQQDEASNPLASSAAAPPSAVEMVEIIMRVVKETEAREWGSNPHSGTSSKLEIRHKTDLQTWTGVFKKGEGVAIALRVFNSSVFGWLNGEGQDGVLENRDEIPVGDPDADMNELRAIFWR